MSDVARQRVARNVGRPFVFRSVCTADTNIPRLERFELLLCAEFIGHDYDIAMFEKLDCEVLGW